MSFPVGPITTKTEDGMAETRLCFYFVSASLLLLLCQCFLINASSTDPLPLSLDYYKSLCPGVLDIVRKEMECAVISDPRNAALIVRLHFHDCFIQGCDGSVLLDDTLMLKGEKLSPTNMNSLGGFRIIDRIKNKLESECPGAVSCADILTIAARDAVLLVGGPYWDVPLGRKDSRMASFELASTNLPTADENLITIISKFLSQGLSITDMVALTGSHTIGMARCNNFWSRIYGDYKATTFVSQSHLSDLKSLCPSQLTEGDESNNVAAMDYLSPNVFDNSFYNLLLRGEGLLNSDQEMYSSTIAILQMKAIVSKYAVDQVAFFTQFSESFVKLGNITNPDSFVNGEVRRNCRFVNSGAARMESS